VSVSSSRVVGSDEALAEALLFASLASDSLPDGWPTAARYFNRLLAATWLKVYAGADSLTLVRQPLAREERRVRESLCAWDALGLMSTFTLGVVSDIGPAWQSNALSTVFEQSRSWGLDSVYVAGDSGVSLAQLVAARDTLLLVEAVLGARAVRPAFVYLSSTEERHAAALPARPHVGILRGYTAGPVDLPGIAIASPGPGAHSTLVHELTHLALAGAKDPLRAPLVVRLAEEALARAMDGRSRSSPGLLSEALVRKVLSTPRTRHAPIDQLDVLVDETAELLDTLGAIYRVSLLRCTVFPLRLLLPPAAQSLDSAVAALGERLALSPGEAENVVVSTLAGGSILTQDLGTGRSACR
jgi:hypothetical protein